MKAAPKLLLLGALAALPLFALSSCYPGHGYSNTETQPSAPADTETGTLTIQWEDGSVETLECTLTDSGEQCSLALPMGTVSGRFPTMSGDWDGNHIEFTAHSRDSGTGTVSVTGNNSNAGTYSWN